MKSIITLSLAAAIVHAANLSIVGQNVTAGEEVEVTITNATEAGSGYPGMTATHLQLGIFNTIYDYWMCSLTPYIPAQNGTVKVTIPSDMGPFGLYYEMTAAGFEDPENGTVGDNIIHGDNTKLFYLSGAKGKWTPAETADELRFNGLVGFWNADIPCSSYACAQDCAAKQFPDDSAWKNGTTWLDCLAACDGVVIDYGRIYEYGSSSPTTTVSVPEALPTPTESCKEEEYHTPCGAECCGRFEYCSGFDTCVDLPLDLDAIISARASKTGGAGAKATGAAGMVSVDWRILGAAAGVFGLAGVME